MPTHATELRMGTDDAVCNRTQLGEPIGQCRNQNEDGLEIVNAGPSAKEFYQMTPWRVVRSWTEVIARGSALSSRYPAARFKTGSADDYGKTNA